MKKSIILGLALGASVIFASCGGDKKAETSEADTAKFLEAQPVASGEYRAVSFQYEEEGSTRMPFDGRIIFSLAPENSAIYVYENGNHTHFKAVVPLSETFSKTDSIYTAADKKNLPVNVIPGAENDTLIIEKDNKKVKIAFERKAVSEMSPMDAMTRISALLSK